MTAVTIAVPFRLDLIGKVIVWDVIVPDDDAITVFCSLLLVVARVNDRVLTIISPNNTASNPRVILQVPLNTLNTSRSWLAIGSAHPAVAA